MVVKPWFWYRIFREPPKKRRCFWSCFGGLKSWSKFWGEHVGRADLSAILLHCTSAVGRQWALGRRPWTQRSNVLPTWRRPGGRGGHLANAVCGSAVLRCCLLCHLCPLDVNTGNPQGVLDQRDRSQITQVIHVALLVCWSCHGSFVDSIHTFRYFYS